MSKTKPPTTADAQKALQLLETLKESINKIETDRATLERDGEQLRSERRQIEEKAWAIEEKLKESETKRIQAEKAASDLEASGASAVSGLQKERDELKREMDEITAKLDKVSELYRETAAEKDKLKEKVDVSDLLAIYIILIEKIFGGKPHARVLYTLHNAKTTITRKNLESSTGIMPTAVIKAIHDLRNADLVSFNEETQEVKLVKDIF